MKPFSNRVFLVVAATLSLVIAVNSLGLSNLTAQSYVTATNSADRNTRGNPEAARAGVSFEENLGQVSGPVKFLSRSGGVTTFLTNDSAWFHLDASKSLSAKTSRMRRSVGSDSPLYGDVDMRIRSKGRDVSVEKQATSSVVRMQFDGANVGSALSGERELVGKVNYLRGNDPSAWVTDVPTFGAVRYTDLYEGVDLVYYGNDKGQMEYDFEVAPGADSGQINLTFSGAENIAIDEVNGDLVISTNAGELRHHQPVAFQYLEDGKRGVEARYEKLPGGQVTFQLGAYDPSIPLIIDPIIGYSTYLGGSGDVDFANAVAVDSSGNAYLTGSTNSANFPTVSPIDGTFGGNQFTYDAFVTKMNAAGTALIYSTYLGGANDDNGLGIAVDASGQTYVTGFTNSTNFPTVTPFQAALNGTAYDGFIAKLNANGSALVYSSYIGGSQNDSALSISIDAAGSAHIAGETASSNFPLLIPFQATYGGGASDAFVSKVSQTGNGLVFSTFLGGSNDDLALGIAVNTNGVHVAGATTSTNFPVSNAAQPTNGGGGFFDGFVSKFNTVGTALTYSTYLGGSDYDGARGIAVDAGGSAYVTGVTASANFPVAAPFQAARSGISDDTFVTRLSSAGSIIYSTYLGGTGADHGSSIAVDSFGAAYITGSTSSTNFPTVDALQAVPGGEIDAFITKIVPTGLSLEYSTYVGGSSFDDGVAIAIDSGQNAFVAGGTDSANFPTVGAFQAIRSGASDGFLLKLSSSMSTISGQVLTTTGQGLRNAVVTLTPTQGGNQTKVPTSSLGFYSFPNLAPGQQYTVSVASRRFRFDPVTVTPNQTLVTINFNGME